MRVSSIVIKEFPGVHSEVDVSLIGGILFLKEVPSPVGTMELP